MQSGLAPEAALHMKLAMSAGVTKSSRQEDGDDSDEWEDDSDENGSLSALGLGFGKLI